MKKNVKDERQWAIDQYLSGEKPENICMILKRSRSWLYKWIKRKKSTNQNWNNSKSNKPDNIINKTPLKTEDTVKFIREYLYKRDLFYGAQAIHWELEEMNMTSIPSIRTINRILNRNGLVIRRSGRYIPKGKRYPSLIAQEPNEIHQADIVGPIYLKGPIRFYSLNVIDIYTARCAIQPMFNCSSERILEAIWSIWWRLGIPKNLQIDNELPFYGSNRYPRGMGALIRLCLINNVQPWFIPQYEPWRNGIIEKFNDLYRKMFINKIFITTEDEIFKESLRFEIKHNNCYKYSKLKGKTPMKVFSERNYQLILPNNKEVPKHPLKKPEEGSYNLIRLIRSDLCLNIF